MDNDVTTRSQDALIAEIAELRQALAEQKAANEVLVAERDLLRMLIDNNPDYLYAKDSDGRFIAVNTATLRRYGLHRFSELIGKTDDDFAHDEDALSSDDTSILQKGVSRFNQEETILNIKTGKEEFLLTSKVPLRDDQGNVRGMVGISRNIDSFKQHLEESAAIRDVLESQIAQQTVELAAERNLLRTLVDSIPDYVYVKDVEGRFILINNVDHRVVGEGDETKVLGKTDYDFYTKELADRFFADDMQVIQTGRPLINREEPNTSLDGEDRWMLTTKVPLKNDSGEVVGLIGISRDITEWKQTVDALRQTELRYRAIVELQTEMIVRWLPDGTRLYVNDVYAQFRGKPASEILGTSFFDEMNADSLAESLDKLSKLTAENPASVVIVPVEDEDGAVVGWHEWIDRGIFDADGKMVEVQSIGRDISERKRTEDALKDQRHFMEHAMSAVPSVVYIQNVIDGRTVFINNNIWNALGYTPEEIIALGDQVLPLLVHPEDMPRLAGLVPQWNQIDDNMVTTQEYRMRHRRGEYRWFLGRDKVFKRDEGGRVIEVIGAAHDITERKQAENDLRRQKDYLSALYQVTLDLLNRRNMDDVLQGIVESAATLMDAPYGEIMVVDEDALVVRAFTKNQQFLIGDRGTREQATLGWAAHDSLQPVVIADYQQYPKRRALYDSVPLRAVVCIPIIVESRCVGVLELSRDKKGYLFSAEEIERGIMFSQLAALVMDNAGLYDASLREIQDRKLIEEGLQESRRFIESVVSATPGIVYIYDLRQNIQVFTNRHIGDLLGYGEEDCHENGRDFTLKVIHPEDEPVYTSYYQRLRSALPNKSYSVEFRLKAANGHWRWFVERDTVFEISEDREVTQIIGTMQDITHPKEADAQRVEFAIQQERLQLLEEFISDISHDIKTPITSIKTTIYLLKKQPAETERYLERLDIQIDRLEKLVENILTMSRLDRGGELALGVVNLSELLHHVAENLQMMAEAKQIDLQLATEADLMVHGNELELNRAIVNLVENAIHYTPDGGQVWVRSFILNGGIMTEIQDSGIGIDPEDLAYIFDRFYRADKARSADKGGTGLGLAIVKKIVELHKGRVTVESQLDAGTTFRLWLPSIDKL